MRDEFVLECFHSEPFSPRLAQQLLRQVCDQALDMINSGFIPPVLRSLSFFFFYSGGKVQQKQTKGEKMLSSKQFTGRMSQLSSSSEHMSSLSF